ncbi:MAG: hypothetical protein QOI12_706 [Alphaproteobacteria bacterium]|nr:hypothetical protein [Alphaproteobacteria bacterium]
MSGLQKYSFSERSNVSVRRLCPTCGRAMRLKTIVPHLHFSNLDIHAYECDGGHTQVASVARPQAD